jgi:hypothetical protein
VSYTIEDGIPIPTGGSGGKGGARRNPRNPLTIALDSLQPGQSVLTTDIADREAADRFRHWRPERKYVTRKIAGQGWRVWRVE